MPEAAADVDSATATPVPVSVVLAAGTPDVKGASARAETPGKAADAVELEAGVALVLFGFRTLILVLPM